MIWRIISRTFPAQQNYTAEEEKVLLFTVGCLSNIKVCWSKCNEKPKRHNG